MTIGIDISQTAYPNTGVGVYTRELILSLVELYPGVAWKCFFASLRGKLAPELVSYTRQWPIPPVVLELLWNKLHVVSVETLLGKMDVWHSSDWTQGPAKAHTVTTVHDLAPLKYPELHDRTIVEVQTRRLGWVKSEVEAIIAVSSSTKRDLVELCGIEEKRVSVVYEAPRSFFKPVLDGDMRRVITKYSLPCQYLLFVGTIQPRKNVLRIVEAWQQVKDTPALVLVGDYGWGERLELPKGVLHRPIVDFSDLPALYTGAQALVFPSLYEGFGLPILEAFACGAPVVTSNTSALPEIGGNVAVYVNPLSEESIRKGIEQVLNWTERKREEVKKASLARAAAFSWKKAAEETYQIYAELCNS